MFGYNPEVHDLKDKVSDLEKLLEKSDKSHAEQVEKFEKQIRVLAEDHVIAMERKQASIDLTVQKATKELNAKVQELTIAKNSAEKEAAMLNKAFENLGFDVKDMKDILNKLVDGVVSKNTIQLVK
jgi:predicted nuclease with TOPRIM domain